MFLAPASRQLKRIKVMCSRPVAKAMRCRKRHSR